MGGGIAVLGLGTATLPMAGRVLNLASNAKQSR